ncbi:hypothetical protein CL628_01710 [bacterium]|mgnify:CR=1 FL=1|nr:hypothetical protein [bacterium]|tara:strand:- start:782 stop:1042 length:261 start_codon:yes stop_codon:yes gene_type:complete
MTDQENLAKRIAILEERNERVTADKAWETSLTRRALLLLFTYLAVALYLAAIEVDRPFLNAIVPSAGFLLSTLTLPWFKQWWLRRH